MTIAAAGDEPEDSNWRFDPDRPPDRFTRRMLGRMSVAHLLMCADHDKSPLNESQQESFDEAYAELNDEVRERVNAVMRTAMPKVEYTWPTPNIDFSAFAPKIDLDFVSNSAYEALSESTKASFERLQRNLTQHLDVAQMIRVPAMTLETTTKVPSGVTEPPNDDESTEVPGTPAPEAPVNPEPPAPALPEVTPDELLNDLAHDANEFAQLSNVVELLTEMNVTMRQQADVVRGQQESAARGLLFYVVVGLGSTLSGIATFVGLGSWEQRTWALGLTAVVVLIAWIAYRRKPGADGGNGGAGA